MQSGQLAGSDYCKQNSKNSNAGMLPEPREEIAPTANVSCRPGPMRQRAREPFLDQVTLVVEGGTK
jgi:hypothetical protein